MAVFVLEYTRNGGNATVAYLRARPDCTNRNTAHVLGHRMLRKVKVAAAIRRITAARYKRLEMSGDEAVALTGLRARADIGMALDAEGKILPLGEWPLELRKSVKEIKPDGTVRLHDQQKATETVLRMTGKLRDTVDVNHFDHLGYLAAIEQKRRAAREGTDGKDKEGSAGRDTPKREGKPASR